MLNVGKSVPEYDEAQLHRALDPGAGSFTPYHNGTTSVIRDIPAGGELFKDYGEDWFDYRYHIFGEIPFTDDYEDARDLLQSMFDLKGLRQDPVLLHDLYQFTRGISKEELFDSRILNALPPKIEDALEAVEPQKDIGTILQKNFTRDVSYLSKFGKCIDHIVPKLSTIKQAGRGAFAVRDLPKGTTITASPLHHVPDKSFANMYDFYLAEDGKWMRVRDKIVGKQLMLNYCFSHPEATILLCPYGSQINYINHSRERANVRVQWAQNFLVGHNQSIIDHADLDFLRTTERPKLAFDYVATKDIAEGEEMFLDYGDDWIKAWNIHEASFKPVPNAENYTSAHQWEKEMYNAAIRTAYEQSAEPYPENLEIRCHNGLSNTHGRVDFEWHMTDYGFPCRIKSRLAKNETFIYTVDLVWQSGKDGKGREHLVEREGVPRKSIRFFDRVATTDLHLPNAFRHPIGIPDDILPEGWKNVKAGASSSGLGGSKSASKRIEQVSDDDDDSSDDDDDDDLSVDHVYESEGMSHEEL